MASSRDNQDPDYLMKYSDHLFCEKRKILNSLHAERIDLKLKLRLNTLDLLYAIDGMTPTENCYSVSLLQSQQNEYNKLKTERCNLKQSLAELPEKEITALTSLVEYDKTVLDRSYRKYVQKNESVCKRFGALTREGETRAFFKRHPQVVSKQAARFLLEWSLKLEMQQKRKQVKVAIYQSLVLQCLLDMAYQLENDPIECIPYFYRNLKNPEYSFKTDIHMHLEVISEYINRYAGCKPKNWGEKESAFEILDPFITLDSLQRDILIYFVQSNMEQLKHILLNMESADALWHLRRCLRANTCVPRGLNGQGSGTEFQQQFRYTLTPGTNSRSVDELNMQDEQILFDALKKRLISTCEKVVQTDTCPQNQRPILSEKEVKFDSGKHNRQQKFNNNRKEQLAPISGGGRHIHQGTQQQDQPPFGTRRKQMTSTYGNVVQTELVPHVQNHQKVRENKLVATSPGKFIPWPGDNLLCSPKSATETSDPNEMLNRCYEQNNDSLVIEWLEEIKKNSNKTKPPDGGDV